jgi:hypothetical protein
VRAYLAIAAEERGAAIAPAVLDAARRAADAAIPVPKPQLRGSEWLSADASVALLAWSNEPRTTPFPDPLIVAGDRVLGYCGYLGDPGDEDVLLETGALDGRVDELGGCFSVFRAGPDGFAAATSIARACPVYVAAAGGLRLAGSRALLVHLAARAAQTGITSPAPAYDLMALQAMVRHGYFTSDETPFQGVSAVPNAATLTARHGEPTRVVRRPLPAPGPPPGGRRAARRLVEPLTEALVQAVRPFTQHDRPVRLALSGGRDSRLIAAALHAGGVPFFGATHGMAEHADVTLAQRVARTLGVECQVAATRERDGTVVVRHPLRRAHNVVRMCEGMNSAYEGVGDWAPFDPEPRTSGSGGERLRGGFLADQRDLSDAGVRGRLKTIFLAQEHLVGEEGNTWARKHHDEWCARYESDGIDVLDKLHMFYRTGRWLAGSHTATLMNWAYYHPFLDNRVVRAALALPVEWRLTEEPVALAMTALAPALRDIPFEGRRWRYERNAPRIPWERPAWRRRATPPATRAGGFNWRRSYDAGFAEILRRQIMDGPPELFDIVDRDAVVTHLAEIPPKRPSQSWNLYTLSVLLSGAWREPLPDLPSVTIPIP